MEKTAKSAFNSVTRKAGNKIAKTFWNSLFKK